MRRGAPRAWGFGAREPSACSAEVEWRRDHSACSAEVEWRRDHFACPRRPNPGAESIPRGAPRSNPGAASIPRALAVRVLARRAFRVLRRGRNPVAASIPRALAVRILSLRAFRVPSQSESWNPGAESIPRAPPRPNPGAESIPRALAVRILALRAFRVPSQSESWRGEHSACSAEAESWRGEHSACPRSQNPGAASIPRARSPPVPLPDRRSRGADDVPAREPIAAASERSSGGSSAGASADTRWSSES
jgi:hypothetical protein